MFDRHRLKKRRLELGYTLQEVADRVGLTKATVQKYESGYINDMVTTSLETFAKALQCTPAYLMGWDEQPTETTSDDDILKIPNIHPIKTARFPLLGSISCGKPILCDENFETFIEASADIDADFCLTAKGDSMINARILNGDIVFIKKQDIVCNGEIAAVVIEDEATLRRVYYDQEENKLVLMAENPSYAPLVYVNDELDRINIIGKAVHFLSLVR